MLNTTRITPVYRSNKSKINLNAEPIVMNEQTNYLLQLDNCEMHCAGQDVCFIIKEIENDDNQYIVGVADGHGDNGHHHSYVASKLLIKEFLSSWSVIKELLSHSENDEIKRLVEKIYKNTNKVMSDLKLFPTLHYHSGTTMALTLVMFINNKRYLISTNAGDSQILWSSQKNEVEELSMDHNCDNPKAVEMYVKRLASIRKTIETPEEKMKYLPKPIYYSRINCIGGQVWNMFKDKKGNLTPISVYKYDGINKDIVNLNRENYEAISVYAPHGCQSVRNPETYQREDGRILAIKGQEMVNWGSTLDGGCQTINGLGDFHYYPHHSCLPHVDIKEISDGGRLIVATDGLTDLFEFSDLMKWFWNNSYKDLNIFYDYLFNISSKLDEYPSYLVNIGNKKHRYPGWDDLSGIFLEFKPIV